MSRWSFVLIGCFAFCGWVVLTPSLGGAADRESVERVLASELAADADGCVAGELISRRAFDVEDWSTLVCSRNSLTLISGRRVLKEVWYHKRRLCTPAREAPSCVVRLH